MRLCWDRSSELLFSNTQGTKKKLTIEVLNRSTIIPVTSSIEGNEKHRLHTSTPTKTNTTPHKGTLDSRHSHITPNFVCSVSSGIFNYCEEILKSLFGLFFVVIMFVLFVGKVIGQNHASEMVSGSPTICSTIMDVA